MALTKNEPNKSPADSPQRACAEQKRGQSKSGRPGLGEGLLILGNEADLERMRRRSHGVFITAGESETLDAPVLVADWRRSNVWLRGRRFS